MKLEIYDERARPEAEKVNWLRIHKLETEKGVSIRVVDKEGEYIDWLLKITAGGIQLNKNLKRELGFTMETHKLLENGHIKVIKD